MRITKRMRKYFVSFWDTQPYEHQSEGQTLGKFMTEIAKERQAAREGTTPPVIPNLHDWSGKMTFTRGTKAEYIEAMKAGKLK